MHKTRKIAILLSWPRELDFYKWVIQGIEDHVIFLIDDMIYSEVERSGNAKNLEAILLMHDLPYSWLSQTQEKYSVLISSGLSYDEVIDLNTICRFIYGKTIGTIIQLLGLDLILKNLFGRPMTAGGKKAVMYRMNQIEREFGVFTIRFPKGLDLSLSNYPEERWRNAFDVHLCHGNIDKKLIETKFQRSDCRIIGYPKYSNEISLPKNKENIHKEFSIRGKKKPLILWMPTHIKIEEEALKNVTLWLPHMQTLLRQNHVLVRPHPKSLIVNPQISDTLEERGFLVDKSPERSLISLYRAADLVFADYGSSVCSACFVGKPVLLLNLPDNLEYTKMINGGEYIDGIMRNYLRSVNLEQGKKLCRIVSDTLNSNRIERMNRAQRFLFGKPGERQKRSTVQKLLLQKGNI